MKRSGFKRPQRPERAPVDYHPLVKPVKYAVIADAPASMPKQAPVRSEAYRRAVAALPCAICGTPGFSQAAHANTGKGMGMKACDLTLFPACADRPGVVGCHTKLDQGALFSKAVRRELEPVWAADTQRKIKAMGQWPANLHFRMTAMNDPMNWMAEQMSGRVTEERVRPTNPRPPGVIRPGSGTDVLLRFLCAHPGRWFFHPELVLALGRSKGEVDWALQYLAQLELIQSEFSSLPGRKPVMRYAIRVA